MNHGEEVQEGVRVFVLLFREWLVTCAHKEGSLDLALVFLHGGLGSAGWWS